MESGLLAEIVGRTKLMRHFNDINYQFDTIWIWQGLHTLARMNFLTIPGRFG